MSLIPDSDLQTLNQDIKDKGFVDREHLMKFLSLIPSNDAPTIIQETKTWLQDLHDDPNYSTVSFPQGDIDAVIGDLDSYGRVKTETIMQFKQDSNHVVDQVS